MTDITSLPYRPCVGIMLVNAQGLVFVGKRIDNREGDIWQMPQGGIDPGEELRGAAMRELREETGITPDLATVIAQSSQELFYDLPEDLVGTIWKGRYRGQRQMWLLVRFTGNDGDVRIDADKHPEFCEWKWVDPETLPDLIVPFKKRVYRAVLEEFRRLI